MPEFSLAEQSRADSAVDPGVESLCSSAVACASGKCQAVGNAIRCAEKRSPFAFEMLSAAELSRLREKYTPAVERRDLLGPEAVAAASERERRPVGAAAGQSESLRASICPECQGSGILRSVYNHRLMERTCPTCEGEAVVVDKPVVKPPPAPELRGGVDGKLSAPSGSCEKAPSSKSE
jgi:hypothetical protein